MQLNWRARPAFPSIWTHTAQRLGAAVAPGAAKRVASPAHRGAGAPIATFACGFGLAVAGLLLIGPGLAEPAPQPASHPPTEIPDNSLARHAITQALRAEAAAERAEAASRRTEILLAESALQTDRFLVAALLLRASLTTARPWLREYQAMAALAPPGLLAPPLAEVLASHAARGLPSEADLRDRFIALAPQLLARAPRDESLLDRTAQAARGVLADIGLMAPPASGLQAIAIAGIEDHLRRGNLAGAVADAGALDAGLQPLLAGWMAQARARMAVEQAVQETLLRALGATTPRALGATSPRALGATSPPHPTLALARPPS